MIDGYSVQLNRASGVDAAGESLTVVYPDGSSQTMRLHEYSRVYAIPGLYEEVVQRRFACASPRMLAQTLAQASGRGAGGIRALDLGAGNGVVGEELRRHGMAAPVGSDKLPEARTAAQRDRPGLYVEYLVDDGAAEASKRLLAAIAGHRLNALTCAGALGPTHIALGCVATLWRAFPPGSWIALTDTERDLGDFSSPQDTLRQLDAQTVLIRAATFRHRLRMDGESIVNQVIVGHKPLGTAPS